MDQILEDYHAYLTGKYPDKNFPEFCHKYSGNVADKTVLAVLQDPGNPGVAESGQCSITNKDPTARKQREVIIGKAGLKPKEILFWNFYPYVGWTKNQAKRENQIIWAKELQKLVDKLVNLKVIAVSGNFAWEGMRDLRPPCGASTVWTPHPSRRGLLSKRNNTLYKKQWRHVKSMVEGSG